MGIQGVILAILALMGGIALFLLGMDMLGGGLQRTAGARARALLSGLRGNPVKAAGAGAVFSSLIHSGPATVVVMAYVNAGLLSLAIAIPIVFGANIGTTLSMQVVSFNVGKFFFALLIPGVLLKRYGRSEFQRSMGDVILGFGILFLGLETMKAAFTPLRESDAMHQLLGAFHVDSAFGFAMAFLVGVVVTGLLQSSAIIVSLLFSLSALGVVTDYRFAVPFLIGAHIGSVGMALLAAPGGTAAAWRVVWSNVVFNVIGAALAVLMIPFYDWLIPRTSADITRQIANFNTIKQVISVIAILPLAPLVAHLVTRLTPNLGNEQPEESRLDPKLVSTPEDAIVAVIAEMRRQSGIVNSMMRGSLDGLVSLDGRHFRKVEAQEDAVDIIKRQIHEYVEDIALRALEPRQVVMLQRITLVSSAIERIGDHVEGIGWVSRQKVEENIWFEDDHMRQLLVVSGIMVAMMEEATAAIDPRMADARVRAEKTLNLYASYKRHIKALKESIRAWLESGQGTPATALFLMRYVGIFDRIAGQLRILARQEKKDSWAVQLSELKKVEPLAQRAPGRPPDHPVHASFEAALTDALAGEGTHRA